MASASRVKEAEKHIAEAEKSLKTSFFKWNPNYDAAANSYEKAAVCYRNDRDHNKAKDTYTKAAEAHYSNGSIYQSGKNYEQAANVSRDANQLLEAAELLDKACERYYESGHPDTGGQILLKAAKLLQHEAPDKAADYFTRGADYLLINDKNREAANACKDAVRMYCRTRPRPLDKILQSSRHAREVLINAGMINVAHETVIVEVLTILMKGSTFQAREALDESQKLPDFSNSDEFKLLDELIEGVSSGDDETIETCCSSGILKALDPEFAKLAQDLKDGKESIVVKATKREKPVTTATSEGASVAVISKNPSDLMDMRKQLFGNVKPKDKRTKTKVESSSPPRPLEEEPPDEPNPIESPPDNVPSNQEDGSDDDEPVDIN